MQLNLSYIQNYNANNFPEDQLRNYNIRQSFVEFQAATDAISQLTLSVKNKTIDVKNFYADLAPLVRTIKSSLDKLSMKQFATDFSKENESLKASLLKEKDGLNDILHKIAPKNIFRRLFAASHDQASALYITTSLNHRISNLYSVFLNSFTTKAVSKWIPASEDDEYVSNIPNNTQSETFFDSMAKRHYRSHLIHGALKLVSII